MSQYSLFDASVFVRKAYDQLVLAEWHAGTDELQSLKWQLLQAWLSLQHARQAAEATEQEPLPLDEAPF